MCKSNFQMLHSVHMIKMNLRKIESEEFSNQKIQAAKKLLYDQSWKELKQKWEIGFCTFLKASNNQIYYIKMKVCVCVCMCVRRPAAGPTQAITPKFGMGSSFHPGSAPSRGGDPKCWPQAPPTAHPRPAHGPPTFSP